MTAKVGEGLAAVTFDLWQTLLLEDRELGRARATLRILGAQQALAQVGLEFTEEHIREAYRSCYNTCHDIHAQGMDVEFIEQVRIFIKGIEEGLVKRLPSSTVKEISTAYADSFFVHPPPPHPDAALVLKAIKEEGYRVGLISNTGMTPGVTFRAYMDQVGILSFFDVLTFSDEVRLAKPAKELFLRTTTALGVPPERTIHVGDHLVNDVKGAKMAGMKVIWIEGFDQGEVDGSLPPDVTVSSLSQVVAALHQLNTL